MTEISHQTQAIELLQQLGMKEYEAKCFVALTRVPKATAKEIADISEVPRTRVYDAIRVLEAQGMVETQHSNPQVFRAVPITEAVASLRDEYQMRAETLRKHLENVDIAEPADEEVTHEVWALTGSTAIRNRSRDLLENATDEIVLVIGTDAAFTDDLAETLRDRIAAGVSVVIGTVDESLQSRIRESLPGADVFVSGLEWLNPDHDGGTSEAISRLILVDRSAILIGTSHDGASVSGTHEQAIFGRGFSNGLVVIFRRLLSTGLLPAVDPAVDHDD
ncbi:helix-turn-helix domain-containing protein [Haloarculaceae archaeon H-GB2-1]|nr:helix-turn-helix domain-containing protein [Haloarculaceae archaeon H-GB1-1]MEA5387645.1 helix-turn-helix domain-containing protein [Haloarculaceae archaeon H-GB11]MEA5409132.1 helix-turn-helix domain-containing protein [Haloarculaceae archaeon H-GB2-1]